MTSALAMATAALVRPPGQFPGTQLGVVVGALFGLAISAVLGLTSRANARQPGRTARLDRVVDPRARAAIWLALAARFPFLLVVVYYRAKATFPPPVRYVYFPFDDKRWETAAYLLGVLAPAIWLTAAARVLAVGRDHPPTWRAWFTGLFPRTTVPHPVRPAGRYAAGDQAGRRANSARRMLLVTAGLLTAIALAWYFAGPPWYLSETGTPISRQEEVVLIGLQAVAKGHLPYVGVASVQYGPGTQVAAYLLIRCCPRSSTRRSTRSPSSRAGPSTAMTGTLLMVPALMVMTVTALPRLLGVQRRAAVAAAGAALAVASFTLLPHGANARASVRAWAEAPYLDRQRLAAGHVAGRPATLAGKRVGPGLDSASWRCQQSVVSMRAFIRLMDRIHALIGDRTAYVANFQGQYPGLVYFGADLNPAPVSSDRYSSIETEPELQAFLADFRTRVLSQTHAVLTDTLMAPEARMFLDRFPHARRISLSYDSQPYYILLR